MQSPAFDLEEPPALRVEKTAEGLRTVILTGQWTLRGLADKADAMTAAIVPYVRDPEVRWDLRGIQALDSVGAFTLWRANDGRRVRHLAVNPEHIALFRRWTERQIPDVADRLTPRFAPFEFLENIGHAVLSNARGLLELIGQFVLDLGYLLRHPRRIPWLDISATIYDAGARALGITALVGLLIGVVVSYLSALQLKTYGAEGFIVNVIGVSVVRELGPMLAAIIVAGRSGSSMAARLGVMRLTQELDAMDAMGISQSLRLVLPKIIALFIAMPLLVVWTDMAAMVGGMFSAYAELSIPFRRFLVQIPTAVPFGNFSLGVEKGAVFGVLIALISCHFGLRIKSDSESLGRETTNAVVSAITLVILADALFAIAFHKVRVV